jgi:hypothetical protein
MLKQLLSALSFSRDIMLEWTPIIESGIKVIAPKLIDSALATASKAFKNMSPYKVLNFDKHFEVAFERCTKVKTIINGDKPIDLLQYYVNHDFKDNILDEYDFIDVVWDNKKIALFGVHAIFLDFLRGKSAGQDPPFCRVA